jgi:hypothetical protein
LVCLFQRYCDGVDRIVVARELVSTVKARSDAPGLCENAVSRRKA